MSWQMGLWPSISLSGAGIGHWMRLSLEGRGKEGWNWRPVLPKIAEHQTETGASFFFCPPLLCFIYRRKAETVICINLNNAWPCPHLLVVINYSMLFCSHSACSIIVLTTVAEKLTPPWNVPFIQVSCISNEKKRANAGEDDGKVSVFSPSIPSTCTEILHGGCRSYYLASLHQCRAVF